MLRLHYENSLMRLYVGTKAKIMTQVIPRYDIMLNTHYSKKMNNVAYFMNMFVRQKPAQIA